MTHFDKAQDLMDTYKDKALAIKAVRDTIEVLKTLGQSAIPLLIFWEKVETDLIKYKFK